MAKFWLSPVKCWRCEQFASVALPVKPTAAVWRFSVTTRVFLRSRQDRCWNTHSPLKQQAPVMRHLRLSAPVMAEEITRLINFLIANRSCQTNGSAATWHPCSKRWGHAERELSPCVGPYGVVKGLWESYVWSTLQHFLSPKAFSFSQYLFSFWRYWRICVMQMSKVMTS